MNEQELREARKAFEEAGIQFVREAEPKTGPRIGVMLDSVKDQAGEVWIAIGQGSIDPDLRDAVCQVLQWVANRGY